MILHRDIRHRRSFYSALDDLKNGRSGRIRQLQNGVQKAGTDKTESYSAIAQNGRAAQNVTSDAEKCTKKYSAEYVGTEYPGK